MFRAALNPIAWIALAASTTAPPQFGAKAMFYDPGSDKPAAPSVVAGERLRSITFANPFPARGCVGLHYWFEDAKGTQLSESRAAALGVPVTLHIRTNVSAFLSVWSFDGETTALLTPVQGQYPGHRMAGGAEFVVPGPLEFTSGDLPRRLIGVFGRSQTEQASNAAHATERLRDLSRRATGGVLQVVREDDDATPGQIGTYIVNQFGSPLAFEIVLRRK